MVAWWQVVVTVVCIILSGTFSGLTLGLMSLDIIDLRVLTESGTDKERWCAQRILPVRKHGNWLLCTLLIGNTAVNSALAIVTADLFGGIAGFLTSTIAILYLGEIIPQAVCHRFGLIIGAFAIPLVKLFMFLTAPLSFPTAKALDYILGGESVTRYNKSQLKSLLSIHGTQADDPSGDPSGDPSARDQSGDGTNLHHTSDTAPTVAVSQRHEDNATVVELSQISAPSYPKQLASIDAFAPSMHPSLRKDAASPQQGNWAAVSVNARSAQLLQTGSGNPSRSADMLTAAASARIAESAAGVDGGGEAAVATEVTSSGKTSRTGPWSRIYSLKRSRMAERSARKEKEREKKERESVSSNPPLTRDEMAMLGGAFDFSQKTVAQVMTALDNVFMLEASLSLNFEVLLLIFQSGHSRVPVYDKSRENIIGVLFAKDLILLDPEDSVPIKTVLLFFNRTVLLVFFDTTLNKMLNIFKQGGGHMAIVQQIKDKTHAESVPDTLGVVTIEDLIEELIGQDIVDETDVYTDNISKQRVKRVRSIDPEVLKMFDSKHDEELLSEKEVLVVASYLSNNTDEFSPDLIDMQVLKDMLSQIPIAEYKEQHSDKGAGSALALSGLAGMKMAGTDEVPYESGSDEPLDSSGQGGTAAQNDVGAELPDSPRHTESTQARLLGEVREERRPPDITIYKRGVPTKNAYLIINGRLEICAGSDGFISEAGPWTLLGVSALTDDLYAPDFTARVIERPARLLRIPRKLYRLMVQYNTTNPMAAVGDGARIKKASSSTIALDPPLTSRRRISEGSATNRSSSSLALAAAAAAVAVGSPTFSGKLPSLPHAPSDINIVHKTRARPNGQSIEWSELEPLARSPEPRATSSAAVDLPVGRSPPRAGFAVNQRTQEGKPADSSTSVVKPPIQPPDPSPSSRK